MHDKVTALIPTYRRPQLLRRAILSVLRQTHGNLQVSVFDDASGDNTEEVVRNLSRVDARIHYQCHPSNIGELRNYKHAFSSVDTPYFSILSDDDFLATDFYENAVNVLNGNPDVMFVILDSLKVDENANLVAHRGSTDRLSLYCDQDRFDALHSGNIPGNWSAMVFRKEVAQIYVDMDNRHDVAHDMRFLFHAAARYNFAYLSKVGAFFTVHSSSTSASRREFDLVHYAVQISRYVEIYHDKKVTQHIRDRAAFYLRRMLSKDPYKPAVMGALRRYCKNCCNVARNDAKVAEHDVRDLRYEGYVKTSILLNILYQSQFIRNIVGGLLGHYNNRRILRHQALMSALQNGIYGKLFKDIREISA